LSDELTMARERERKEREKEIEKEIERCGEFYKTPTNLGVYSSRRGLSAHLGVLDGEADPVDAHAGGPVAALGRARRVAELEDRRPHFARVVGVAVHLEHGSKKTDKKAGERKQ